MDAIKTFPFQDGKTLEIHVDENPQDPREWDNMGTLALFHPRYNLGDKDHGIDHTEFAGWDAMEAHLRKSLKAVVLPVYMYDHSGLAFSTSRGYPFNCPWDSMQVGFIYVSKAALIAECGNDSPETRAKAVEILNGEIVVFNEFHSGAVYGFILREPPCSECSGPGEQADSCWGFFGGDDPLENGMIDHLASYRTELEAAV